MLTYLWSSVTGLESTFFDTWSWTDVRDTLPLSGSSITTSSLEKRRTVCDMKQLPDPILTNITRYQWVNYRRIEIKLENKASLVLNAYRHMALELHGAVAIQRLILQVWGFPLWSWNGCKTTLSLKWVSPWQQDQTSLRLIIDNYYLARYPTDNWPVATVFSSTSFSVDVCLTGLCNHALLAHSQNLASGPVHPFAGPHPFLLWESWEDIYFMLSSSSNLKYEAQVII